MARILAAALLAGAAATAIALAPAASADRGDTRGPSKNDTAEVDRSPHKATPARRGGAGGAGPNQNPLSPNFNSNLPTGWTNEGLWGRPGASNPFGSGPRPPVVAMD